MKITWTVFICGAISCSQFLFTWDKNRIVCEFDDGLCYYTLPYITLMQNYKQTFYYIYLCLCACTVRLWKPKDKP